MPILKILPDAVDSTNNYTFGNVFVASIIAGGTNLTTLAQSAFNAANTAQASANNAANAAGSSATVTAAFNQANTATVLAQAAFNQANTGGGSSGGIISLSMPGTLNTPFTGTSRYYPTRSITLGTVYANLSANPSSNLQFVILKNGVNIGNSFIISTNSPVMTPVVTGAVTLSTNEYLTLNVLGANIQAADLSVKITYT